VIRIWHVPRSRSHRVVWLCEEMGLDYEVAPVSFRRPDPAFALVNPLGGVPVLEDGDVRMIESVAILLYLAGRYGPTELALRPDEPGYADYLQFLMLGEASLGAPIATLMYDRFRCPEAEKGGWLARDREAFLEKGLAFVDAALTDRPWLAGDRFTLADVSTGLSIGVAANFLGMTERMPERVRDYLRRLTERPAWRRAAEK
jgi:glutathione S-transferase